MTEQRVKKLGSLCGLTSLGPDLAWRRRNHHECSPTRDGCVFVLASSWCKKLRGTDLLVLRSDPGTLSGSSVANECGSRAPRSIARRVVVKAASQALETRLNMKRLHKAGCVFAVIAALHAAVP